MMHYTEKRNPVFAVVTGGFVLSFRMNGRDAEKYVNGINDYQASHRKSPDANPVYRIARPKRRRRD